MQKIAFYGKGGIGKSTIATSVSAAFAVAGRRVLHVGCDPKHDSTLTLTGGRMIQTVLERLLRAPGGQLTRDEIITRGALGIDCIEAGGPMPGSGCGGRGVSRMFEVLDRLGVLAGGDYDAVIFDVLGDVVCGGFAAPLRRDAAEKVVIVASEELMALYAANEIAKAIVANRANGVVLGGLVINLRDNDAARAPLQEFADRLHTRILEFVPRSAAIREAERGMRTIFDSPAAAPLAEQLTRLAARLEAMTPAECAVPTPLGDAEFRQEVVARAR